MEEKAACAVRQMQPPFPYFNEDNIFIFGRFAAQANKIHANVSLVNDSVLEHS